MGEGGGGAPPSPVPSTLNAKGRSDAALSFPPAYFEPPSARVPNSPRCSAV